MGSLELVLAFLVRGIRVILQVALHNNFQRRDADLDTVQHHSLPPSPRHPLPFKPNRLIGTVSSIPNDNIIRDATTVHVNDSNRLVRREVNMSLSALLHRDERIVESRQNEADRHESHGHVSDGEAHDLARIMTQGVEGRVREAEDDGENGH